MDGRRGVARVERAGRAAASGRIPAHRFGLLGARGARPRVAHVARIPCDRARGDVGAALEDPARARCHRGRGLEGDRDRRTVAVTDFPDIERFARSHAACGGITPNATTQLDGGYLLTLTCACGVSMDRWITAEE